MTHLVNRRLRTFIGILTLVVLLIGAFFVVKAVESKEVVVETKAASTTTYFYNGPNSSLNNHVTETENWSTSPEFQCGDNTLIPCNLEVPSDMTLEDYLDELGSPQAIIDASEKGRTP